VLVHDGQTYRNVQPAFVLPSYNGTLVEYVRAPDNVNDLEDLWRREEAYRRNAIPAAFVYHHDLDEPGKVLTKIAEAYRSDGSTRYRAT